MGTVDSQGHAVLGNEVVDCLAGMTADITKTITVDKQYITAILSMLQDQEDTSFEGSTHELCVLKGCMTDFAMCSGDRSVQTRLLMVLSAYTP